jgi:hypothetical protein
VLITDCGYAESGAGQHLAVVHEHPDRGGSSPGGRPGHHHERVVMPVRGKGGRRAGAAAPRPRPARWPRRWSPPRRSPGAADATGGGGR